MVNAPVPVADPLEVVMPTLYAVLLASPEGTVQVNAVDEDTLTPLAVTPPTVTVVPPTTKLVPVTVMVDPAVP